LYAKLRIIPLLGQCPVYLALGGAFFAQPLLVILESPGADGRLRALVVEDLGAVVAAHKIAPMPCAYMCTNFD
jgi:hypothetical protein